MRRWERPEVPLHRVLVWGRSMATEAPQTLPEAFGGLGSSVGYGLHEVLRRLPGLCWCSGSPGSLRGSRRCASGRRRRGVVKATED
mmetsp:Transcript_45467/g.142528  ORF Transcript_45467/g.142528 Transcript_45467/m.142528 type:complete len:86 (+) Transcript_45467:609-866(+)